MKSHKGFTLIELLVVVAIIGVLASIAIPQFADYKKRAFDARAQSDLRSLITAEEAYYVDNEEYTACLGLSCESGLPGFVTSEGVQMDVSVQENRTIFHAEACHLKGEKFFTWDSMEGEFGNLNRGCVGL